MTRNDFLLSLVKSSATGNHQLFRSTVEAIIADERAKQHSAFADRLATALGPARPALRSIGKDLLWERTPVRALGSLILCPENRMQIQGLIDEQRESVLLRSSGLEPRHKGLLIGPPGNGKTTLAECVAESLGLPFFIVRYESLLSSYLGETSSRLKQVFDDVRTLPCVVLFDEFDIVGKERSDGQDVGEIKRVVSNLLMQIDTLPSSTIVFAATNHAEMLDSGVWRRFDLRLSLPNPSRIEIEAYLNKLSDCSSFVLPVPTETLSRNLIGFSYAMVEQFFLSLRRKTVLSGCERISKEIMDQELSMFCKMIS